MDSSPGGALELAYPCPEMITAHWLSPALILGWLEQEYFHLHAGPKDRPQPSSKDLWESLGSSHFEFQICAGNDSKGWGDSTVSCESACSRSVGPEFGSPNMSVYIYNPITLEVETGGFPGADWPASQWNQISEFQVQCQCLLQKRK